MSFAMSSFCPHCAAHRGRLPFGTKNDFFDSEPCPKCGTPGPGFQLIAKSDWRGRWTDRAGSSIKDAIERGDVDALLD